MSRRKHVPARRAAAAAVVVPLSAALLAACGGSGGSSDADDVLTVWTVETQPERLRIQQEAMDAWAADSGLETELVPVEEEQIAQQVAAAALAGDLPDAVNAISPGLVRAFDADGYLDREAAAEVIDGLGEDTFAEPALELSKEEHEYVAVPSDAWPMMVYYRTDLFEQAGLEPPTTYESLLTAAETLTTPDRFGITLATDAADPFTQQTLEFLSLGNGCRLVDDDGTATLDSEACGETIDLYTELAGDLSPEGTQSVDSTRATYLAGQSAMVVWSSFLLDEMAGLVTDHTPTCPECADDVTFLAENTAVTPVVAGPSAEDPAGYVELVSWGIMDGADDETADFVEYMMSDAYVDWLSMAPVGKVPVRLGPEPGSTEYAEAWSALPIGVDTKEPFSDAWDADVLDTLAEAPDNGDRWAIAEGQGAILGPVTAELPLAKVASDLGAGSLDAAAAQEQMQESLAEIADRD